MKKIVIIIIAVLLLTSCTKVENKEIIVAEQYGLAYAPIQIMKAKGFLESRFDGYTIKWVKLANTAAIREAMLAEDLDVGFMGIPPFLIGKDQKMPWKIMTGLSISPLGLVTNDPSVTELKDLVDHGKIVVPQPGSIQHILLTMAAKELYGDSKMFDHQLLSMKHPDGYQALLADTEVKAHFTSPPYLFKELDEDSTHLVISGDEAMGETFTFIVGVCQEKFYQEEAQYKGFIESINESIAFINNNREETIEILSEAYELEPDVLEDYLYNRGMIYTNEVLGVERFIQFMYEEDYLSKTISEDEVIWE